MEITIVVIGFLIVIIGIITYLVFIKRKGSKVDPTPSHKCVGDECPKEIDCGVLSPSTIKKCNPQDVNSICNTCICSGTTNLTGCMVCTEVNNDHPYHVDIVKEQCTDPFFWDNGMCKLKDGHYCLPKVVNDITCPSTGRKLLIKTDVGYDWKCICKNDTQFTGPTCSDIKICGMLGANADTDNPTSYGRGVFNKNKNKDYWSSSSTWDPLVDGNCQCGPNEIADNTNYLCLPNGCYPGTNGSDKEDCKCPEKYISCNSIATVNDPNPLFPSYYSGVCKIPSCVPDPCGGQDGNAGYYDITRSQCVCNTADNYELISDPTNIVGQSCQKVCVNNGICADRGTCYYYDNSSGVKLFTIACSGNISGVCTKNESVIYFQDSNKKNNYINYNITGNNINLSVGPTGNVFIFEIYCDTSDPNNKCPPAGTNALSFQINVTYYLKIGNQYVDLIAGTFTTDKSKSLVRFLNTNQPNQKNAPNISTQIFIVNSNSYFSVDNNNTIVFPKNYSNSERCKDCNSSNGWNQDSQDLCNRRCIKKDATCVFDQDCCDGMSCKFGLKGYATCY